MVVFWTSYFTRRQSNKAEFDTVYSTFLSHFLNDKSLLIFKKQNEMLQVRPIVSYTEHTASWFISYYLQFTTNSLKWECSRGVIYILQE